MDTRELLPLFGLVVLGYVLVVLGFVLVVLLFCL